MQTKHKIEIACSADAAYSLCCDVGRWPDVFPPCIDAVVLAESERSQHIRLIAKANDTVMIWESLRELNRPARTIAFKQARPSPLVTHMRGGWSVTATAAGCEVELTHEFEIKDDVHDLVPGVATSADAREFMLRTIETNSTKELAALKSTLERAKFYHEFSAALVIPRASKAAVYRLLADLRLWPWLLPHCDSIEMLYDDQKHQEFRMEVRVGDGHESIRSIRMLGEDRIDYFQPAPPPALSEHIGWWTVREVEGGVEVVSWHGVVLAPGYWLAIPIAEAKAKVEAAINANSVATMRAIASKLEGTKA
jgi:aromatase